MALDVSLGRRRLHRHRALRRWQLCLRLVKARDALAEVAPEHLDGRAPPHVVFKAADHRHIDPDHLVVAVDELAVSVAEEGG